MVTKTAQKSKKGREEDINLFFLFCMRKENRHDKKSFVDVLRDYEKYARLENE